MGGRLGAGPVFTWEWMRSARRWQIYAARAGVVAVLLAGLTLVWLEELSGREATFQRLAEVGQTFSMTIVLTQLALVLLVAPAMTAGAICQDKTNGTLAHLLVTDLSSAEIVLGKLAARLVPVLGLIACSLPIVAISTLLGGTDPVGLAGAYLVTIGAAVLACALAMVLSVWGTKVHEVLVATYLALIGWVMLLWVCAILLELLGARGFERLWMIQALILTNPLAIIVFPMAGSPFSYISLAEQAAFLVGCLSLSVILVGVATARVRAVAARAGGPVANPWWWRVGAWCLALPGRTWPISALSRRRRRWRINPTLDGNPVLWREWHRNRPSRWGRALWLLFIVGAGGFSLLSVWIAWSIHGDEEFACLVNALSVSVGLLMVLAPAVTSLAEERARGSLDVLLTTTLTTREVVWGKWLASYRVVPRLALLAGVVALLVAEADDGRFLIGPPLVVGLVLAEGAAVVSLGLFLALTVSKLGRAVGWAVAIYLVVTIAWPILMLAFLDDDTFGVGAGMASPFMGPLISSMITAGEGPRHDWEPMIFWSFFWIAVTGGVAAALIARTMATFDHHLGRVPDPTARGWWAPGFGNVDVRFQIGTFRVHVSNVVDVGDAEAVGPPIGRVEAKRMPLTGSGSRTP